MPHLCKFPDTLCAADVIRKRIVVIRVYQKCISSFGMYGGKAAGAKAMGNVRVIIRFNPSL